MSRPAAEYDDGPLTKRVMTYRGRNLRYFNIARKVAYCSLHDDYRHGAGLVKGGSVISTSCNKNSFSSFATRFCVEHDGVATLHAELGAILGVDRSITEGASIYVCRVGKDASFRLSKPCSMCFGAMKYVGIKRAIWTIDDHNCGMVKL